MTASPSYQPWAGGRRVRSSATVLASAGRRVIREGLSEEVTFELSLEGRGGSQAKV